MRKRIGLTMEMAKPVFKTESVSHRTPWLRPRLSWRSCMESCKCIRNCERSSGSGISTRHQGSRAGSFHMPTLRPVGQRLTLAPAIGIRRAKAAAGRRRTGGGDTAAGRFNIEGLTAPILAAVLGAMAAERIKKTADPNAQGRSQ